jgi:hypothetical protein
VTGYDTTRALLRRRARYPTGGSDLNRCYRVNSQALTTLASISIHHIGPDMEIELFMQRGSGPSARDVCSGPRLGANWVPELQRKATKPETVAGGAKAPM